MLAKTTALSKSAAAGALAKRKAYQQANNKPSKRKAPRSHKSHLHKIVRQRNLGGGGSKMAMNVLDSFVRDVHMKISLAACEVAKFNHKNTITVREVEAGTGLVLPQGTELYKANKTYAEIAVQRYNGQGARQASDNGGKGRSKKAGLVLSVAMADKALRGCCTGFRVGGAAAVYLAAVAEQLSMEVIDLAVIHARQNKKSRITPRNIWVPVENDDEFRLLRQKSQILTKGSVAGGGTVQHIHAVLLPKKRKRAT